MKKKTIPIQTRIPIELNKKLKRKAKADHYMDVSELVRDAIRILLRGPD